MRKLPKYRPQIAISGVEVVVKDGVQMGVRDILLELEYLQAQLLRDRLIIDGLRHNNKKLVSQGTAMSNICYNLSQQAGNTLSDDYAECMEKSWLAWDRTVRETYNE